MPRALSMGVLNSITSRVWRLGVEGQDCRPNGHVVGGPPDY